MESGSQEATTSRREAQAELPTSGYATLVTLFAGVFGTLLAVASVRRHLPKRIGAGDLLLLGTATHKLSRIVTRDRATMPLREPFAEFQGNGGAGEVDERPKGRGLQRAVGELVTCPFCIGPWIASALMTALVARPRPTRVVLGVLSSVALSDFLQLGYSAARRRSG